MKQLFILLFITSFLLFPDDDGLIKIMSYNIRYAGDEKTEGIYAWSKRKELVASVIRSERADIVGLQEALKLQLNSLVKLLPDYSWVGAGRDDGKEAGEYSAIFYNKNKFEVIEYSNFWLSETPEKPSRGWDAALNRIVTWAKFRDKTTGDLFYHFNTHFDHKGEIARLESANLLNDMITETAAGFPVVVTGDFNFKPDSKGYEILTGGMKDYLTDAAQADEEADTIATTTFNDYGRSAERDNKIDYIFIKNDVAAVSHKIISATFNGRYASDHFPVAAEIRIGKSEYQE